MSIVTDNAPAYIFQCFCSFAIFSFKFFKSAFPPLLIRCAKSFYHFSRIRKIKSKSQEIHSFRYRKNLCLCIKLNFEFICHYVHFFFDFIQILFALVNHNSIIHVSYIMFYMHFFFYQSV